jgi:lysophospholipase L1-like esterase
MHRSYLIKFGFSALIFLAVWGMMDILYAALKKEVKVTIPWLEFVDGLGMVPPRDHQMPDGYINSLGFRGEQLPGLAPEEIRILVLGDSVTYGISLQQGEDWPARLQQHLRKKGVPATVLNAAVSSTYSQHMLKALRYYNDLTKVDIVLLQNTGNLLVNGVEHLDWLKNNGAYQTGEHIFPDHAQNILTSSSDCQEDKITGGMNAEKVNIPTILKYLSSYSPFVLQTIAFLETIYPNPPPVGPSIQSADYDKNGYPRVMLCMGLMIQFAKQNKLPFLILEPSYIYNWDFFDRKNSSEISMPNSSYKGDADTVLDVVDGVGKIFSFFKEHSDAFFINLLDNNKVDQKVAMELYRDYTHYTKKGSEVFAEIIGDFMMDNKIVQPIKQGEWMRPGGLKKRYDLRFKEIPDSLSYVNVFLAGVILTFFSGMVGFSVQIFMARAKNFLAPSLAPLLGFFVLVFGGMLMQSFSISPYKFFAFLAFYSLLTLSWYFFNHPDILRVVGAISIYSIGVLFFTVVIFFSVQRNWSPERIDSIKRVAAWSESMNIPKEYSVLENDLIALYKTDGIIRPTDIPKITKLFSEKLYAFSPVIPAMLSSVGGMSPQDTLIGFSMFFATSLFMAIYSFRKKSPLVSISINGLAAGGAVCSVLYFPTQLIMVAICSTLLCLFVILHDEDFSEWIKYFVLFAGAGPFYFLPVKWFAIPVVLVLFVLFFKEYLKSRCLKQSSRLSIFVLIVMLSSRVILFNTTVVDPEFDGVLDLLRLPYYFF